jgi:hypothetical protein
MVRIDLGDLLSDTGDNDIDVLDGAVIVNMLTLIKQLFT